MYFIRAITSNNGRIVATATSTANVVGSLSFLLCFTDIGFYHRGAKVVKLAEIYHICAI